jgi:hypothetical protein
MRNVMKPSASATTSVIDRPAGSASHGDVP